MRRLLFVSAALLAACASSQGSSAPPPTDQTVRIPSSSGGSATTLVIAPSTTSSTKQLAASVDRIWGVLPAVYASLGLPVTDRSAADHTTGSSSFKIRHRLDGVSLSRYLDCGSTQGSPSADSYEILLSVNTRVSGGASDSTTVSVSVDAMGRPVFVSAEYIHCGSTGGIEKRFFEILRSELKR
jgi:hypothetical protein